VRFYDLRLTNAAGMTYQPAPNGNSFVLKAGGTTFSSQVNGMNNPGALDVNFDLPVYPFNTPQGNSSIIISGVGLGMLGQAAMLTGANFTLMAGMAKGLPLATAQAPQAGLIAQGQVFQSFGNWEGTSMSLNLIFNASITAPGQPIVFNWMAGTPVAQALAVTLTQAFPKFKQKINIGNLVLPENQAGVYENIQQFAGVLTGITQAKGRAVFGDMYSGVLIVVVGNTIIAYDSTTPQTPKMLAFQDLMGQPTWIGANTISFKTVLRSDLAVGSTITFPQGVQQPFALTAPSAAAPNAPASSKTAFQGSFLIGEAHHFASFRQSSGDSWCTAFTASPITPVTPPAPFSVRQATT
jgi:hypothetical protein